MSETCWGAAVYDGEVGDPSVYQRAAEHPGDLGYNSIGQTLGCDTTALPLSLLFWPNSKPK